MNLELFEREMRLRLSPRRFDHTMGCVQTAQALAKRWDVDEESACAAALLHDMTKELSVQEQLKFCIKHDIIINDTQRAVPEILHAVTGAKAAQLEFGVSREISDAIRWHSTAKPDMSNLEKIIWLADMSEPGRSFDGVDDIRRECEISLDSAMIMGIDRTLKYLIYKRQIIDPIMLEARNWLIAGKDGF